MNAYVLSKVDIRMFITAIIYNSQNLETTQCLSTEERINYGIYIYIFIWTADVHYNGYSIGYFGYIGFFNAFQKTLPWMKEVKHENHTIMVPLIWNSRTGKSNLWQ